MNPMKIKECIIISTLISIYYEIFDCSIELYIRLHLRFYL